MVDGHRGGSCRVGDPICRAEKPTIGASEPIVAISLTCGNPLTKLDLGRLLGPPWANFWSVVDSLTTPITRPSLRTCSHRYRNIELGLSSWPHGKIKG